MKNSKIDSELDIVDARFAHSLPRPNLYVQKLGNRTPSHESGWTIELIDNRVFERECFETSVRSENPSLDVVSYATVEDWDSGSRPDPNNSAIIFNIGNAHAADPRLRDDLRALVEMANPTPVLVLAVSEDLSDMLEALDAGVRGYIPTSVGVAVMIGATRLALLGGVFLPARSVLSMRESLKEARNDCDSVSDMFTTRQAAVADALRRGKANKTIAYELNMCESTVKVHIRTIMKKTRARNRTEAAYKLHQLFPSDAE
ncbi:LuxR C-terminal-related transcriptional regulator [Qingshengfaniella alkalisoli]|uniref:Response regulator transcription factor n=1 Tax=Qingshengfaniella alkalisoli TaxID=2599296 RepID=A0A5B8I8S1_9RHOB|nr:response regulator transcription factor [Qingshengfaniella alkalisoli]QDY70475.1 response regulator transcription factor [Qingshengfaniella alkalisoli]